MNARVVVDASVAVKWMVNEVYSDRAFALAQSWEQSGIMPIAPYLMPVEVANAIYRRVTRGEVSLQQATSLLKGSPTSGLSSRSPFTYTPEPSSWLTNSVRARFTTHTTSRSRRTWTAICGLQPAATQSSQPPVRTRKVARQLRRWGCVVDIDAEAATD